MKRDQFISLFFIALLVFVIYQICLIFSPFVRAVFWSAILAFVFFPIFERLKRRLRTHDTLAATIMTLLIFLIVIPPVVILIINVTEQAFELYQSASDYVRQGNLEKLIENLRSMAFVQNIEARVVEWEPLQESAKTWILNSSRAVGNFAATQAATLTKNLLLVSLNVLMMVFLVFVFLKDGDKIYRFFYQIAPMEEAHKKSIFNQISETFSAVIRGQLLTALTQAILAGIAFWILAIPIPILFAAATFITSLIPVVGASAVWLPLVIYLFLLKSYAKAVILFAFGALVISLIDNILKPAIIGEKTKLPYFLLFFGILGGIKLYGVMGIFLGPAVLSLFFALVRIYRAQYL